MAKSKVISKTEMRNAQASYRAYRFFIGGCCAEAFLMLIRKYYVDGTANQVVAWDGYMYPMAMVGAVIALIGLGGLLTKGKSCARCKEISLWVLGAGAFVAVIGALIRTLYTALLTPALLIVPVVMLLGILWCLYAKECAMAVSILGVTLVAVWMARKALYHVTLGGVAHVALGLGLVALAVVAYMTYKYVGERKKAGKSTVDVTSVYLACGASAITVAINLVNTVIGYYAMIVLMAIAFLLVVRYTVKSL